MAVEIVDSELYTFHIHQSPTQVEPVWANKMKANSGLGIVTSDGEHKGHLVALITSDYTKCLHDEQSWSSGTVKVRPLQPTDAVTIIAK